MGRLNKSSGDYSPGWKKRPLQPAPSLNHSTQDNAIGREVKEETPTLDYQLCLRHFSMENHYIDKNLSAA